MWKNTYSVKSKSLIWIIKIGLKWRANSSFTQEIDITFYNICVITTVIQHHMLSNVLTKNTDALYVLYLILWIEFNTSSDIILT